MNRAQSLNLGLKELSTGTSDQEAAPVVDADGLLTPSLRGLSESCLRELSSRSLPVVMIPGSEESAILFPCDDDAVLTVLAQQGRSSASSATISSVAPESAAAC